MHLEVEQKFRVASLAAVRRRVAELGGKFAEPIDQVDTYFAHPSRDFAQTDEALRLRQVGDLTWITYKGPKLDRQTKTRRELELPLPAEPAAFQQFTELLTALGFRPVASVRKRREAAHMRWAGMEVEVALDTVADVGQFVELEISADATSLEMAKGCLTSLAKQAGLSGSERRSYLEMLLAGTS